MHCVILGGLSNFHNRSQCVSMFYSYFYQCFKLEEDCANHMSFKVE